MNNEERIILTLACVALAALLMAQILARTLAYAIRELDNAETVLDTLGRMKTSVVILRERNDETEN